MMLKFDKYDTLASGKLYKKTQGIMSVNSIEQFNTNNSGINLYKTYSWFEKNYSPLLESAIQEFWDIGFDFKLISISENINYFFGGSEYFVTRIKLDKENQFVVRISKDMVRILLDVTLGSKNDFEFEKITELEAKILTSFNNFIYDKFSQILLSEAEKTDEQGETTFAFLVNFDTENETKILITIPNPFLKYTEIFPSDDRFGIEDFPKNKAEVNLYVGSTLLPLNDIKNLEKEDIIVLEESNINNMTLKFENNEIGFRVSPDPSLIISFDDDNGSRNMSKNGNIWDNIQVDISAEFEKVKISLGEIKQISEGLVVDMGSVYENKVDLKVENKVIAKGELVIINDRYGVRIDEIFDNETSVEEEINVDQSPQDEESYEQDEDSSENFEEEEVSDSEQSEEDDEFDYKDFDVDDESI